ncbi:hypothetical protein [Nostocoides veronense]|uniref:Uncharacterized protein n=1 Tax=Nostocoides veronense TaxID=330836 RepID=A0ABP4XTS0_9MICO
MTPTYTPPILPEVWRGALGRRQASGLAMAGLVLLITAPVVLLTALKAPTDWRALSVCGVLLAFLALVWPRRESRLPAAIGTHDGQAITASRHTSRIPNSGRSWARQLLLTGHVR